MSVKLNFICTFRQFQWSELLSLNCDFGAIETTFCSDKYNTNVYFYIDSWAIVWWLRWSTHDVLVDLCVRLLPESVYIPKLICTWNTHQTHFFLVPGGSMEACRISTSSFAAASGATGSIATQIRRDTHVSRQCNPSNPSKWLCWDVQTQGS